MSKKKKHPTDDVPGRGRESLFTAPVNPAIELRRRAKYQRTMAQMQGTAGDVKMAKNLQATAEANEAMAMAIEAKDERIAELRRLIAECLALKPVIVGGTKEVNAWGSVLERMKKAASKEA